MNNFNNVPQINITRSRFKMKHRNLTTMNFGKLIPFNVIEVLPGDTFKNKTSFVCRMTTPIKPVMDNAYLDIYYFFVPNRIIWDHWEEFQGANKAGHWKQQAEYTIPQVTIPYTSIVGQQTGWHTGTIADYMGIPTYVQPTDIPEEGLYQISVNALPFRAICQIWNDWFRDENLQDMTYFSKGDTTITGSNGDNYVTDPAKGGMPLPVAKYHDFYTSALPEAQKGPEVLLPLGTVAPIKTTSTSNEFMLQNTTSQTGAKIIGAIGLTANSSNGANVKFDSGTGFTTTDFDRILINSNNVYADLTQASAATINDLRQAFALQKMFERDARGGTRYIEILKNHFGVTASDARLQRAEYLGGEHIPINMTQIAQTSSTDATSPQGNVSAFSLTVNVKNYYTKSFEEHGYIIGVACARTEKTYQQGLNKMWSRQTREDFYMPVFANIGEQPIKNKEIYLQGTTADNETFGFQEAWAEYRYIPNIVTGEMRSNSKDSSGNSNTLDFYHYADDYSELPTLSSSWITEKAENVDRTIVVPHTTNMQLQVDFYMEEIATRPMPLYSIPGLIDHN